MGRRNGCGKLLGTEEIRVRRDVRLKDSNPNAGARDSKGLAKGNYSNIPSHFERPDSIGRLAIGLGIGVGVVAFLWLSKATAAPGFSTYYHAASFAFLLSIPMLIIYLYLRNKFSVKLHDSTTGFYYFKFNGHPIGCVLFGSAKFISLCLLSFSITICTLGFLATNS